MGVGALTVSATPVLIGLSGTSPGTASFYRCLLSIPPLLALAAWERRQAGPPDRRVVLWALVAGALFAGDMLLWTQALLEVGAGLSTVLVNLQVVMIPLLGWLVDGERLSRRFLACLPVLLLGVVCTSGVLDHGHATANTVWGIVHAVLAAVCYSGFLFLLRRGGKASPPVQPYLLVMASAAVMSLAAGAAWYRLEPLPGWTPIGWLVVATVCGQVLGWLWVARSSPKLSHQAGAALLLLTPVGAVALGAVVLGERPTGWQAAGCALILGGAYLASRERRRHPASRRPRSGQVEADAEATASW
jgi:drug/metabolite transporter (DMT)-like permease